MTGTVAGRRNYPGAVPPVEPAMAARGAQEARRGGDTAPVYGVLTLLLPVPHDELFDYIAAGAHGPDHHLLALTPRQREQRTSARRAVPEILGSRYHLTSTEPPHRLDLALADRDGIGGMVLVVPSGPAATALTLYLWAAPAPWRPWRTWRRRRHIHRILQRAQRLPAVVAHPSWPGAWPG